MSLFLTATSVCSKNDELHCPRCALAIEVAEIEWAGPLNSRPVDQQIVCPGCAEIITTVYSTRVVFAYRAGEREFQAATATTK
jgi:hypothetical protein